MYTFLRRNNDDKNDLMQPSFLFPLPHHARTGRQRDAASPYISSVFPQRHRVAVVQEVVVSQLFTL